MANRHAGSKRYALETLSFAPLCYAGCPAATAPPAVPFEKWDPRPEQGEAAAQAEAAQSSCFSNGTAGGEAIFAYQNINHRIHLSFVFIRRHIVQRLVWSFIVVVVVPSLRLHPYLINGSEDAGIRTAFELLDGLAFRSYIIDMNGPSYRLRATENWLNSRKEKSTEAKS